MHLSPPLRGEIDGIPIAIIGLSVIGARVRHEMRLLQARSHRMRFSWDERNAELQCELVRSTIPRLSKKAGAPTLYESGLRFTDARADSAAVLRELVAEYVVRAINEQLANARGIPPLAVYSYQSGKGGSYRRCEFIDGKWRRAETTSPEQPLSGFTISADIDPYHFEMLCRTWEACDEEGRELTRTFAQLSVSKAEGIPTRRYVP